MSRTSEIFGRNLAAIRKQKDLTQMELAALCGWESQSRLSNYENCTRTPDLDDIEHIARALGTDVATLVSENAANGIRETPGTYVTASKSQKIKESINTLLSGHLQQYFNDQTIPGKIHTITHLYELLQDDAFRVSITSLSKSTLLKLLGLNEL